MHKTLERAREAIYKELKNADTYLRSINVDRQEEYSKRINRAIEFLEADDSKRALLTLTGDLPEVRGK